MMSGKAEYKVSKTIGDRIKMDVLMFLRNPCKNPPANLEKYIDCEKKDIDWSKYTPSYTILQDCIHASSGVLIRKLNEMENDYLIVSFRPEKQHNKRYIILTSLGEKVADCLLQLNDVIEKESSESQFSNFEDRLVGRLLA